MCFCEDYISTPRQTGSCGAYFYSHKYINIFLRRTGVKVRDLRFDSCHPTLSTTGVRSLISLFEALDSRTSKTKRATSQQTSLLPSPDIVESDKPLTITMDVLDPTSNASSQSPFSSLRLSLLTAFQTDHSTFTPFSTPSTSPSLSPFSRARRGRSSSPQTTHSFRSASSTRSPMIRRRPSAVDMALEEERSRATASYTEARGLGLLEPRPVEWVPISVGRRSIWDGSHDEDDGRGTVVMGGIFETMEGR